jgi:thiamine pyrophosphokinase
VVVGDLDSVDPTVLEAARDAGAVIETHPTAKDATDLELALVAARRFDPTHLEVIGGAGGRLDHLLANALLLGSPVTEGCSVLALVGSATVAVARPGRSVVLDGSIGELVSLLPVNGPAVGVRTSGLRYELRGDQLDPGRTRGVSNELCARRARVSLDAGVLLAVLPGRTDDLSSQPDPTTGGTK